MGIDYDTLNRVGQVWKITKKPGWIEHEILDTAAQTIEQRLIRRPARSVLLVGDHGAGKTTLAKAVGHRLAQSKWAVFEAGAGELLAGQSFIGQLEEQIRNVVEAVKGGKVLWYIPNFHELAHAGRHQYSPVSVLDQLVPIIEQGDIHIIGETSTGAYERLVAMHPRLRTSLHTVDVAPLDETTTLHIAQRWVEQATKKGAPPLVERGDLQEALALSKQYLAAQVMPGALFRLLRLARVEASANNPAAPKRVGLDDLLSTLARLTGLPRTVLDDREGLDIAALTAHFQQRVLGQEEAVETLVDRVAMIKAGLTDPSRPSGVFLFVGPTGTGKTELAKALAEYLFGSSERMVRFDMSEFQTYEALDRLLGSPSGMEGSALVDHVRKHPFSVILLDEFEKASSAAWDLFLQVFDDGRLTDRQGHTVDFRHTIIIMTSNLGAAVQTAAGIGFGARPAGFEEDRISQALGEAFRPEFLNRIDRIVTFQPLSRATMRELLQKELKAVLRRRGFRRHPWAVEWDESALSFLLEEGFTPDLGARPLKRAIERHLLAPLARTIVTHAVPEGDQFLFIRAGKGGLVVEFVDPDADDIPAVEEAEAERPLEAIAFAPHGSPEEMGLLRTVYEQIAAQVEGDAWAEAKAAALEAMAVPAFWEDPDRFVTLGRAEHMDRIEAGLETAASLMDRLTNNDREGYPPALLGRLAERLYLLREALAAHEAGEVHDAVVLVEGIDEGVAAQRVGAMYKAWADERRMRLHIVEEQSGEEGGYKLLMEVSGFGAYQILRTEAGLHVFEREVNKRKVRSAARVRIASNSAPPVPAVEVMRQQQEKAPEEASRSDVVRRYREGDAPLVRDAARGWRTGHLDRVLGGDFDLITP